MGRECLLVVESSRWLTVNMQTGAYLGRDGVEANGAVGVRSP